MTIWDTDSDTKYFDTVNNKLCFKSNSDVWKMSYFKVVGALMMFYKSIIGSVHIVAWFGHFYLVNKGW